MPSVTAQTDAKRPTRALRRFFLGMTALCVFTTGMTNGTQTAIANGDTRTLYLYHVHTKETIAATYRVNGSYDSSVLKQLNWFLRDWRKDEPINMDPRLFDVVWETYRSAGAGNREVVVMSAYRSPSTNAMLRARSRAVAKHSQHMEGKAMDTSMPGMSMSQVREIGMRLQRGGVGYYPSAGTPFVHLDVGSVRSWPRMGYDQLARLFPDGKTVHLPSNGQPLARYEEARAELEARGAIAPPSQTSRGFFAFLFGGGEDAEETAPAVRYERPANTRMAGRGGRGGTQVAAYAPAAPSVADDDSAGRNFFALEASRRAEPVQAAQRDLPRGETYLSPPSAAQPQRAEAPQQVAALQPADGKLQKPQPLDDTADEPAAKTAQTAAQPPVQTGTAPLPPRRPTDLPVFAATPTPPTRPGAIAAVSSANSATAGLRRETLMPIPRPVAPTLAGLRAVTPSAKDGEKLKDAKTAALTPSLVGARSAARAQAATQAARQPAPAMAPLNPPMPAPRPQKAASAGKSRAN